MGNLVVGEMSFQLIGVLRPLMARIKKHDKSLADQLGRAASSIALNIAESDYSDGGNKRARLFTAAGSANETRAALRVATEWGYLPAEEASAAQGRLDQIIAILWKLTHR
jgi:four helix bundle protein